MNLDFAALSGQRVFLTGGTGFFGKSLLWRLNELGAAAKAVFPNFQMPRTTVLSRDPGRFLHAFPAFASLDFVEWLQGDVRTFPFPAGCFDSVIHAASPTRSTPGMRDEILQGAERVLRFATARNVKRILFASSGAVYGSWNRPEGVSETMPCRPDTDFGAAKLEAERLLSSGRVPVVCARCFSFAGFWLPRDREYAFGNFLRDCLSGGPIVVRGDGSAVRSWMHARDLTDWLLFLLLKGEPGAPCNVGSPDARSIAELAETMRRTFGLDQKILVLGEAEGSGARRYVPDVSRAEALGLRITISLDEAIRRSALDPTRS